MNCQKFRSLISLFKEVGYNHSDTEEEKIKGLLLPVPEDLDNLVYWKVFGYTGRNDAVRGGLIPKKFYNSIQSETETVRWRCLDEISKYEYFEYQLKDMEFSWNKETIIDFYLSNERGFPLEAYLEL